ncbi:GAP family protein [Nonomuraea sp. NPDC050691]|uniref:GAP family protein n=1 Tax=Nonomuraea sp. NPDC050691 TaxID=3155661 RepID=UPI0033DABEDB
MPIAVGVIISPVSAIAAILIVSSRRGALNGFAFALGWFVGVLLIVLILSLLGVGAGETPVFFHWVNLFLGLFLWWLARREYHNRGRKELPAWLQAVDDLKPHNAALFGLLATIANPKNLPLGAAAGVILANSDLSSAQTVIACAVFAAVSSLGMVLAAVLRFTSAGAAALGRLKDWLAEESPGITIALFLVVGTLLINSSVQAIGGS